MLVSPTRHVGTVHALVPDAVDDPLRPSGGNQYDRIVLDGLRLRGWRVEHHPVGGAWTGDRARAESDVAELTRSLRPDNAPILVDSLVATHAPVRTVALARQRRVLLLAHALDQDVARVAQAAAAVIVPSQWAWRRLQGLGVNANTVRVAEPGGCPGPIAPRDPAGARLLTVAPLVPAKGHEVLLDALAGLDDVPFRCTWVGPVDRDPVHATYLRRRVAYLGLGERIHIVGPSARVGEHYASADLLVHPSRSETYGMVVTEALAHGVPVIASQVGGTPEALGVPECGKPPGRLVPVDDARALQRALTRWFADPVYRETLRAGAVVRRSHLPNWTTTLDTIEAALRSARNCRSESASRV